LVNRIAYVGAPLENPPEGIMEIPVLKIEFLDISRIKKISDILVLTSKRGVISLRMSNISIKSERIYCIGKRTSEYLQKLYSLKCEIPEEQNSTGLADLIEKRERKVMIVGSDHIPQTLLETLASRGVEVKRIVAYRIEEKEDADYGKLEKADKILVGSPGSFEILMKKAGGLIKGKKVYAIGKPTLKKMTEMKFEPAGYFKEPNIENILSQLITEK
jgi:uroporphyrinogen-III synthase